jgi:hypothetical protein
MASFLLTLPNSGHLRQLHLPGFQDSAFLDHGFHRVCWLKQSSGGGRRRLLRHYQPQQSHSNLRHQHDF